MQGVKKGWRGIVKKLPLTCKGVLHCACHLSLVTCWATMENSVTVLLVKLRWAIGLRAEGSALGQAQCGSYLELSPKNKRRQRRWLQAAKTNSLSLLGCWPKRWRGLPRMLWARLIQRLHVERSRYYLSCGCWIATRPRQIYSGKVLRTVFFLCRTFQKPEEEACQERAAFESHPVSHILSHSIQTCVRRPSRRGCALSRLRASRAATRSARQDFAKYFVRTRLQAEAFKARVGTMALF